MNRIACSSIILAMRASHVQRLLHKTLQVNLCGWKLLTLANRCTGGATPDHNVLETQLRPKPSLNHSTWQICATLFWACVLSIGCALSQPNLVCTNWNDLVYNVALMLFYVVDVWVVCSHVLSWMWCMCVFLDGLLLFEIVAYILSLSFALWFVCAVFLVWVSVVLISFAYPLVFYGCWKQGACTSKRTNCIQ